MRRNCWNCSTGVIEVSYPMTMTVDDVQDFKDAMAITFRILERTATNGQRQLGETTSDVNIAGPGIQNKMPPSAAASSVPSDSEIYQTPGA